MRRAIRSVTHLALATTAGESKSSTWNRKELGAPSPCQSPPSRCLLSATLLRLAPTGVQRDRFSGSFSILIMCMLCSHPPLWFRPCAVDHARPSRFSGTRKRSVPVRVHSVYKNVGFAHSRCQAQVSNPFVTRGTVESPIKLFSCSSTALCFCGARPPPISPEGSRPTLAAG